VNVTTLLAFVSALFGGAVTVIAARRERRSVAKWLFVAGMGLLAAESVLIGLAAMALANGEDILRWYEFGYWEQWRLLVLSLVPGVWLCFSLSFARGDYHDVLKRWRLTVAGAFLAPPAVAVFFHYALFRGSPGETPGQWRFPLNVAGYLFFVMFLVVALVVLRNLERTFRASVGTMRWRIKFRVIGLGVLFAVKAYTASQVVLARQIDPSLETVDCGGLLLGCLLMLRSLSRDPCDVAVYPARSGRQFSLTLLVAGVYLFIVGVLAQVLKLLDAYAGFPSKAFLILVCVVAATILLLSDRVRLHARRFISRSLQRPLYDYRTVWRNFTQGTVSRLTENELCKVAVKLAAEVFQVLSVTIWLVDDRQENLRFAASTSLSDSMAQRLRPSTGEATEVIRALRDRGQPTEIEQSNDLWASVLRRCQPSEFESGGGRVCVPMTAAGELLGVMLLADRVGGVLFSVQDFDLLKCVADQVAAGLLNSQLSQKLLQAKELEAFQTMSAFFVHDLKNTASTLNLMIQNLPVHFDNPAFREDALRAITKSGQHINQLIVRLSLLRHDLHIRPVESDLNDLVAKVVSAWNGAPGVNLVKQLGPVPKVQLDQEQFHKVVTNLVLNATEAISKKGEIRVETGQNNSWAVVAVADNGCGMDAEFISRSLFRPFQTTKKNGFGIGMFQSRMIVEAHGGRIDVESQLGKGTTFRVFLPLKKE
jgi:putative PEP-CTERM system histidine kinase